MHEDSSCLFCGCVTKGHPRGHGGVLDSTLTSLEAISLCVGEQPSETNVCEPALISEKNTLVFFTSAVVDSSTGLCLKKLPFRKSNLLGPNCFKITYSSQKQTGDLHDNKMCLHSQNDLTECKCSFQKSSGTTAPMSNICWAALIVPVHLLCSSGQTLIILPVFNPLFHCLHHIFHYNHNLTNLSRLQTDRTQRVNFTLPTVNTYLLPIVSLGNLPSITDGTEQEINQIM